MSLAIYKHIPSATGYKAIHFALQPSLFAWPSPRSRRKIKRPIDRESKQPKLSLMACDDVSCNNNDTKMDRNTRASRLLKPRGNFQKVLCQWWTYGAQLIAPFDMWLWIYIFLLQLPFSDSNLEHFQAPSHRLNQCWQRSMTPYGITGPQCVNI